ncbi:MAG: CPXCG motif-containing cysteine-rich protein [Planctomycetota bacterium]
MFTASYICDSCGEEIVVPIDVAAGASQRYVEDCPVCCHPNVIHVTLDEDDGEPSAWSRAESS